MSSRSVAGVFMVLTIVLVSLVGLGIGAKHGAAGGDVELASRHLISGNGTQAT